MIRGSRKIKIVGGGDRALVAKTSNNIPVSKEVSTNSWLSSNLIGTASGKDPYR